jgi:hypothetical protein
MDTTIYDLYGTQDNAWADMKKVLRMEPAWRDAEGPYKVSFQTWMLDNAQYYKDGEKIDWVGAFYDFLED